MQDKSEFLGTEPIGKLLFRLALPTVAAQIINMLYNIVDRIYIGHMPGDGDLALTGLGICMPIILIVSAFAALISSGGAPRASIYMGQGDNDAAERMLGSCIALQIVISAVLTTVLLIWNRDLLMAFGGSENTIDYAVSYMNIYAIGTIFVELTLGMNAFITAQGYANQGMKTILIGAGLNIVLDPIFIFGFNMGVRGAALATVISQAASCAWVLAFLGGGKGTLRVRKEYIRLDKRFILACVSLGIAPFIMQSTESILSVCFNSSLQRYGGDLAVGAMTILTSANNFAMLPMMGIAQGAQPILSYNFGAGNKERVKKTFFLLVSSTVSYAAVLWLLIELFPRVFCGVFTPDETLLAYSARVIRIYCGALILMGAQNACQMTFISMGNAKASAIVAIMRKFVLLIPLIYIMPLLMEDKTIAVYAAEPVADVLAVTFTVILFSFQFRKALKGMDAPKTE